MAKTTMLSAFLLICLINLVTVKSSQRFGCGAQKDEGKWYMMPMEGCSEYFSAPVGFDGGEECKWEVVSENKNLKIECDYVLSESKACNSNTGDRIEVQTSASAEPLIFCNEGHLSVEHATSLTLISNSECSKGTLECNILDMDKPCGLILSPDFDVNSLTTYL